MKYSIGDILEWNSGTHKAVLKIVAIPENRGGNLFHLIYLSDSQYPGAVGTIIEYPKNLVGDRLRKKMTNLYKIK